MAIYSCFSRKRWWFSIAMIVYQRVSWFTSLETQKSWLPRKIPEKARLLDAARLGQLEVLVILASNKGRHFNDFFNDFRWFFMTFDDWNISGFSLGFPGAFFNSLNRGRFAVWQHVCFICSPNGSAGFLGRISVMKDLKYPEAQLCSFEVLWRKQQLLWLSWTWMIDDDCRICDFLWFFGSSQCSSEQNPRFISLSHAMDDRLDGLIGGSKLSFLWSGLGCAGP